MISVNYAKKNGNGYILNLFADTADDIANFDVTKPFGMYGVPLTGSVVTLVTGTSATNYYIADDGTLTKIANE